MIFTSLGARRCDVKSRNTCLHYYSVASFPGHTHFSMLHAEKGEGLVHEVTCMIFMWKGDYFAWAGDLFAGALYIASSPGDLVHNYSLVYFYA